MTVRRVPGWIHGSHGIAGEQGSRESESLLRTGPHEFQYFRFFGGATWFRFHALVNGTLSDPVQHPHKCHLPFLESALASGSGHGKIMGLPIQTTPFSQTRYFTFVDDDARRQPGNGKGRAICFAEWLDWASVTQNGVTPKMVLKNVFHHRVSRCFGDESRPDRECHASAAHSKKTAKIHDLSSPPPSCGR